MGTMGLGGASVTTTTLQAGDPHCAAGGVQLTAANGTSYVCNGAAGTNGQSVTGMSLAAGDAHCQTGGTAYTSSSGTQYVCNGLSGPPGTQGPAGTPGPHLVVQTVFNDKVGYLMPFDGVVPTALFAHKEPSWGIPNNFPEGWIIQLQPTHMFFASTDCSGTPYASPADLSVHFTNSVLYHDGVNANLLYQPAGTPSSLQFHSDRNGLLCLKEDTGPFDSRQMIPTNYQLPDLSTPWKLLIN